MKTYKFNLVQIFLFLMVLSGFSSCSLEKVEPVPVVPIPDFTISNNGCYPPCTIIFENNSQNAHSYLWEFGDGDTSTLENPEHTYLLPGDYEVTLTAYRFNLSNKAVKTVTIQRIGTFEAWQTWKSGSCDYGYSIASVPDGSFIITGYTYGASSSDVLLMRADACGNTGAYFAPVNWDFNGRTEVGYAVISTSDGGYLVTGSTQGVSNQDTDLLLVKFDSEGKSLWDDTWGTPDTKDVGYAVDEIPGGGFIVVGATFDTDNREHLFVLKLEADGQVGSTGWEYTDPEPNTTAIPALARNQLIKNKMYL